MAKSDQGSAMPEDSIAAMPVGEEIALAVDLPEKPDESIFLDSVSLEDFETELVRVPSFGKHKKNAFYQRHPDPSWNSRTVGCVDVGMGEVYVCSPKVLPHLMEHGVVKRRIYTLQDLDGDIRFCGYKVSDEDGNLDTWNQSAHRILAEDDSAKKWFKFISMKKAGKYMKRRAISQDHAPPEWNMDQSFDEMFFEACKDRYVNNLDHAVAKTILGAE